MPTLFAAAAFAAAYLAVWLDEQIDEPIGARFGLVSDPSTAGSFAGTIAAATLAFVAVVFATTLVATQLAASQYSPRTVRVFIRSRVTRVTLGLFLATFVFAMVIVVSNRSSVASAKQYSGSSTLEGCSVSLISAMSRLEHFEVFPVGKGVKIPPAEATEAAS